MALSKGYFYVATPYSKYALGFEKAHEHACEAAAALMAAGVSVYCPIAHTHSIAKIGGLPLTDHDFWMKIDKPLIEAANGLILVEMEGYDKSAGIKQELYWMRERKRPIVHMPIDKGFRQGAIDVAWIIDKLALDREEPRSHPSWSQLENLGEAEEAPLPPLLAALESTLPAAGS